MLLRILIVLTGAIIGYQLFVPPIVGLADQGDFVRVIGRFGYGQEPPSPRWKYAYVPPKFVPTNFRIREWEQPTSEYLFLGIALLLNRVISKDGSLCILVIGSVHALFFLLIYARLLRVTGGFDGHKWLWVAATLVLTDVGYVAYWNSFYREPASLLFALALIAETIAICRSESPSTATIVRWVLWSALFVASKEQNTALALLLVIFLLRLRTWSACHHSRIAAALGVPLILTSGVLNVVTSPLPEHEAAAYNVLFLSIVPESRNPSADLEWFGLSPRLAEYSGTNRWSVNTGFSDPEVQRNIGRSLRLRTTTVFFLRHPGRMWRHMARLFSGPPGSDTPASEPATPPAPRPATSLRPEFCGNFEQAAGYAPGTRSRAFAVWSALHERVLPRLWKYILLLLPAPVLFAAWIGIRGKADYRVRRRVECAAMLSASALISLFTAAFADGLDNVKHMYLFNALLDMCLLWLALLVIQSAISVWRNSSWIATCLASAVRATLVSSASQPESREIGLPAQK